MFNICWRTANLTACVLIQHVYSKEFMKPVSEYDQQLQSPMP